MLLIESGHRSHARRSGKDRGNHRLGDQIEGREVVVENPEPVVIRQKRPMSIRDAKPKTEDKVMVKCRQSIRAGQAQTIPLTQAKNKFLSHTAKCQSCLNREQCATA